MAAEFPPPGFLQWGRSGVDPYEEHVGPFYQNPDQQTMTMLVTPRMCNALGILHGGALMSFCDAALYVIAREHTYETTGRVFVTFSFSIDFLSRCRAGAQVLAGGEVVKVSADKDLILVHGWAKAGSDGGRLLATFRGMLRFAGPASIPGHRGNKDQLARL
ncbi:unnamed protein product [Symbiodinium natans]|uniref:Thioesterase domain-containing protein n=1 Tax=Symbiodinium natans TaxID=878477 RepID=A0A812HV71_9DINO|nr:unnamed protein product [Symbiodinium natans]